MKNLAKDADMVGLQFGYTTTLDITFTFTPHGRKRTIMTGGRLHARNQYWHPLRDRLCKYIQAKSGNQRKIAKALDLSDSQLHRYTCPKCEHDAEPTYSVGKALEQYLSENQPKQKNKHA